MRHAIIECDRCAQQPLDPRRIESVGVSQRVARRIERGPNADGSEEDAAAHDFEPKATLRGEPDAAHAPSGILDLCPKCQAAFVLFMKNLPLEFGRAR